jgi:hypothetical protein
MKDSAIVGFIIAAFVAMVLWRSGYIAVDAPKLLYHPALPSHSTSKPMMFWE